MAEGRNYDCRFNNARYAQPCDRCENPSECAFQAERQRREEAQGKMVGALGNLLDAVAGVDYLGEIGDVEALDEARREATELIEAP